MKPYSFKGRAKRSEYFIHTIAAPLVLFMLLFLCESVFPNNDFLSSIFVPLIVFISINELFVTVRRFHDLGRPGFHLFFLFIPFVNFYYLGLLVFKSGRDEPNEYDDTFLAPPPENVRTIPSGEYYCSRCKGEIIWGATICPHCGDTLEY